MTRFNLRTLILLSALLPATFGMLWRCGQIDGETRVIDEDLGGGRYMEVRVGSYALVLSGQQISLAHAIAWARHKPQHDYVLVIDGKEIPPAMQIAEQREDHPWNGRQWHPVYEYVGYFEWREPPTIPGDRVSPEEAARLDKLIDDLTK